MVSANLETHMHSTGKQPHKPATSTAQPTTTHTDPDRSEPDPEAGEGSYSGTRDYQESVKSYLETADVEQDARDAAPENAGEARELEQAEKAGRKGVDKAPARKR
jgi:hypothetical protein